MHKLMLGFAICGFSLVVSDAVTTAVAQGAIQPGLFNALYI